MQRQMIIGMHLGNGHGAIADIEVQMTSGTQQVKGWYVRSAIESFTQLSDGRMGYIGTVKDDVPYLLGRAATSVRE